MCHCCSTGSLCRRPKLYMRCTHGSSRSARFSPSSLSTSTCSSSKCDDDPRHARQSSARVPMVPQVNCHRSAVGASNVMHQSTTEAESVQMRCNKAFTCKANLYTHEACVHSTDRHPCDECNKQFSTRKHSYN